jgi:PKD repeat protein
MLFDQKNNLVKMTFRDLKAPGLLAVFLLLPALTHAETVVQSWVQRYNGQATGNRHAKAVAVDSGNNAIVTGYSEDSMAHPHYATIKYSGAGVPVWTNLYIGPNNSDDQAQAVAVDANNNVFVTGYSVGNSFTYDYATIKYSSAGVPLWTNRYNGLGNGEDRAVAVVVDANGNVFVTGYSVGALSTFNYATIKYSNAGAPLWTNSYDAGAADKATALTVDGANNVIVTGSSISSSSFNNEYATIKYSNAGVAQWTNRYHGPLSRGDQAAALAVDGADNVIVTGSSGTGGSYSDYATIKYSSAGVPQWTNRYDGPVSQDDQATGVAVDGSNNVIVTGFSTGTQLNYDYTTLKYSSAGAPIWTNRYNGPANQGDKATAVAVDASGNTIVTGYSASTSISPYNYDYATLKYSSAGVPLWTNRYTGAANSEDEACALAIDHNGNVFVTGYSVVAPNASDYATIEYKVVSPPVAGFTADVTSGVAPLRVVFTNLSTGATNYGWAFGDGNLSTTVQPTNTYTSPATYSVTLSAVGLGGTNILTRINYIVVVAPSTVANFTADRTTGVAPLTVVFTNLSTGATNYGWAFGDGNLSTNVQPANTYTNAGTYSVTLSAVGLGGTNTLTRTTYIVVVPPPPVANFTADRTTGVAPLTVVFTNLSTGATNYGWAFGDGNLSSKAQPTNTYTNPGTYSVTLSAVGLGGTNTLTRTNYIVVGSPPLVADFTADRTTGVAPLTVVFTNLSTGATRYGWVFGDGNFSSKAQPTNTYTNPGTYSVTLVAVGQSASTLTRTNYIVVVPPPPVEDFTADRTTGVAPLTVGFTNLSTGATDYGWAFGDGNLSTNVQPTNTYTNPGAYSVTLSAVGLGGTNTLTRTNYIVVVPPPPVADFTADRTTGVAPLTVGFTNLSTGATDYGWAFGDGNLSTNVQPANTYTNPGSYSVTLSAVGPGGTNILTRANYIVVVPPPPVADFTADRTIGVAPLTVVFTNLSTGATNYGWAFGDGKLSTAVQPANTYTNPGSYSVTLSVVGPGGTNILTRANYIVVVPPPPVADFTADRTTGVAPLTVVFTNLSTGATNYGWAFGDGNLSTNVQPANTYTNPGTYSVTLSAMGPGGTNLLTRTNYIVVVPLVPRMAGLQLTNGMFQLRVDNVLQSGTLVIEARTNLSPSQAYWSPIFTNYTPTNVLYYTDPMASNYPRRFYRAYQHAYVPPPPVADFTADRTTGVAPLTVVFTNLSTGATNYSWAFGDGNLSTKAQPTNTYTNLGSYSVTLSAVGPGGTNILTRTNYIVVVPLSPLMAGLKLSNGTFQLRVDNVLQPGTLVIEACTNLSLSQAFWSPVFTNTTPTNVLYYTDPKASNYLRRFYRAFQFP